MGRRNNMNLKYAKGWRECNPFGKWDAVSEDFLEWSAENLKKPQPWEKEPNDDPAPYGRCAAPCNQPLTEREYRDNLTA